MNELEISNPIVIYAQQGKHDLPLEADILITGKNMLNKAGSNSNKLHHNS